LEAGAGGETWAIAGERKKRLAGKIAGRLKMGGYQRATVWNEGA